MSLENRRKLLVCHSAQQVERATRSAPDTMEHYASGMPKLRAAVLAEIDQTAAELGILPLICVIGINLDTKPEDVI